MKYDKKQRTRATQYDIADVEDVGPHSIINRNIAQSSHYMIYECKDDFPSRHGRRTDHMQIPDDYFEAQDLVLGRQCQLVVHEHIRYDPDTGEPRTRERVMAPRESAYAEYNYRHAPTKDPWIGYGPRAAKAADEHIKGIQKKKHTESDGNREFEDVGPLRHPRVWFPTNADRHVEDPRDAPPGFRINEIVSIEGIVHLQDLSTLLEHSLHISEPVVVYEPRCLLPRIDLQCYGGSWKDIRECQIKGPWTKKMVIPGMEDPMTITGPTIPNHCEI